MASIFNVSKYILQKKGKMTTMKLQKLAYYCQAWSLVWEGVPLFDEEFQAWANGPVNPELFSFHKGQFVIDASKFEAFPDYSFSPAEIETLDSALNHYGDRDPQWLSELTHKERPWKEARAGVPVGEQCANIIEKEIMQEYYGGLSDAE